MTMENIKQAIEHKGLIMNRVPAWAKNQFKELAKDEFDDNYGQALAGILKDVFEYRQLKNMLLSGELSYLLQMKDDIKNIEQPKENVKLNMRGQPIFN